MYEVWRRVDQYIDKPKACYAHVEVLAFYVQVESL